MKIINSKYNEKKKKITTDIFFQYSIYAILDYASPELLKKISISQSDIEKIFKIYFY